MRDLWCPAGCARGIGHDPRADHRFIGPGLSWPEATLRLSAFYYYGTPLLKGLPVLDTLVVVVVAVVALGLASARVARKDIGR